MNVNLRQLRTYVCIARVKSFTKAAEILNASQPTLSAQIRELEDALNVRLFDRNTRAVALTPAGEDLFPAVDQLLTEFAQVMQRAQDVSARIVGRVSIAALPSVCSASLPLAIAAFRTQNPGITVKLRDAVADRALDLVCAKEVDFGVSSMIDDPKIEFVPVTHDDIVAVLPLGHPLATSRTITLTQLLKYPLILMDRDSSVRHIVDAAFASIGRMIVPEYEATFMSSAVGMVRAGLGITLLPTSAHEVIKAETVIRRVKHPALRRSVGIIKLRGRSLSPAANAFIELYARHARQRPAIAPGVSRPPRMDRRGSRASGDHVPLR